MNPPKNEPGSNIKIMNRLKEKYQTEIKPKLKEEFGIKNEMQVPRLEKIVINVGAGAAKDNAGLLETIVTDLGLLSGQKPIVTKSKKSIAGFKLGKGQSVGVKVTLRGERMYQFLDKLIGIVLPKVRDFRGLSDQSFDSGGNYTLGLREQTIFPEIGFKGSSNSALVHGLEICIVNNSKKLDQGRKLLTLMGMPFKKA